MLSSFFTIVLYLVFNNTCKIWYRTIFESITIQVSYPSSRRSILLTSAYRSNGIIPNVTQAQQMECFFDMFSDLIFKLQDTNEEFMEEP